MTQILQIDTDLKSLKTRFIYVINISKNVVRGI